MDSNNIRISYTYAAISIDTENHEISPLLIWMTL